MLLADKERHLLAIEVDDAELVYFPLKVTLVRDERTIIRLINSVFDSDRIVGG